MKNTLINFFIVLFVLFLSKYTNATTYTTVQDGAWTSSSTWDANGVPPSVWSNEYINVNHKLTISSDLDISYYVTNIATTAEISGAHKITINAGGAEINNYGKINVSDITVGWGTPTVNNYGDIYVSGTIESSGNINNKYQDSNVHGYIEVGNLLLKENTLTNNHHIKVTNNLTTQGSSSLVNSTSGTLYVVNDVNITANTTITNDGDLYVDGTVDDSNGSIAGTGEECNSDGSTNIPTSSGGSISCGSSIGPLTPTLPVELIEFKAEIIDNATNFTWTTASEIDNDFFTLFRSKNTKEWKEITTIMGAGNSNTIISYQHTDFTPINDITYFKLKQTDFDGKFSYSKIISIENKKNTKSLSAFPNPTKDIIIIDGINSLNKIKVFNIMGQDISSLVDIIAETEAHIRINFNKLPNGIYIIKSENKSIRINKI